MSRNWNMKDSRCQQMRYNGRYPVNEMWDVRQSLIDDFQKNVSTNKHLASMDRKCSEYLHNMKQKKGEHSNWRSHLVQGHLNMNAKHRSDTEESRNESDNSYVEDDPYGVNYTNFEEDRNGNNEIDETQKFNSESIMSSEREQDERNSILKEEDERNLTFKEEDERNSTFKESLDTNQDIQDGNENKNVLNDGGQKVDKAHVEDNDLITDIKLENEEGEDCITNVSLSNQNIAVNNVRDKSSSNDLNKSKTSNNTEKTKLRNISAHKKFKDKRRSKPENKHYTKNLPTSYKEFVKSVSKLVSLNTTEKKNKIEKDDIMTLEHELTNSAEHKISQGQVDDVKKKKEKLKHKSSFNANERILRSTRRSSRSGKTYVESEPSPQKKCTKKKTKLDVKSKKLSDSCKNKSKIKIRGKYPIRSKRNEHESEKTSDSEREVTSTSKAKHVVRQKRKSLSSPDEDIPLAKYTKLTVSNNIEEDLNEKNDPDETAVFSNCEENFFVDQNLSELSANIICDEKVIDEDEAPVNTTELNVIDDAQKEDNLSNLSIILINESDSDNRQETEGQISDLDSKNELNAIGLCSHYTDLDSKKNTIGQCSSGFDTDIKQNTSSQSSSDLDSDNKLVTKGQGENEVDSVNNNNDSEKCPVENLGNSQHSEEKLWTYLKCDYCDFMVSRKKPQCYDTMEEHLDTTKHNAASTVKVSIHDGELMPVFIKKEHSILRSLEKASVLPYCPTCSTVMPSVWTAQLHAKHKHGNQFDMYGLGKVENVVNVPVLRRIDMCKQCGQRKASIQKHWKTHNHYPYVLPTENQFVQFSCSFCHRHFETFFSALSHAVVHFKQKSKVQTLGVKVTYISKSQENFSFLPRDKILTSWRAMEILNQAKNVNKPIQWTRAQRKEFEMMTSEWKQKRILKKHE